MKQEMADHRCSFGGELSGHFYFRTNFNADSGAIAMATVLSAVAASGKPVSAMVKPAQRYVQSGEINFEIEDKDQALAEIREHYIGRGTIDDLDGVTVDCFEGEGWWANIRKSNTEPLLRLNCEARDAELLAKVTEEISPLLGERVDH
jgi:phosphomannomutase